MPLTPQTCDACGIELIDEVERERGICWYCHDGRDDRDYDEYESSYDEDDEFSDEYEDTGEEEE